MVFSLEQTLAEEQLGPTAKLDTKLTVEPNCAVPKGTILTDDPKGTKLTLDPKFVFNGTRFIDAAKLGFKGAAEW